MNPIRRKAVRAVMLTREGRILLMQAQEPNNAFTVWFTPGGGMEPGEDAESCLRREIREETGLDTFKIGPAIWKRHHTFEWAGVLISQDEVYHLIPVEQFEPITANNPSLGELSALRGFRWWAASEIAKSEDLFAPRGLSDHLNALILNGPPPEPLDVGI